MGGSRNNRSTDPADAAAAVLARHLSPGQCVTVALSGGVDSVVLMDVLRRLQSGCAFVLRAVHVDHGISPLSRQWAEFCSALCARLGVPLQVIAVSVARDGGKGLEAAARAERYRALSAIDTDWIALGHQQDDQIETLLLNLLRGSGPRGAAGMPEARPADLSGGTGRPRVLRPLLAVTRSEIEAYAREHGLSCVEDESNADTAFTRNFLRNEVVPVLARRFPAFRQSLARSAAWSAEATQLLDALARIDAGSCVDSRGRLSTEALSRLDAARGKNLLRYWLRTQGEEMPDAEMLWEIRRQLVTVRRDNRLRLAAGKGAIRSFRGWASIEPEASPATFAVPADMPWNGEASLIWGDGKVELRAATGDGIAASLLRPGEVTLRARGGGEHIRLHPARPRRSLKNLLQEAAVPPWQRMSMPLLWCGGDLVWVPGVGIASDFRCSPGEPGLLPIWQPA